MFNNLIRLQYSSIIFYNMVVNWSYLCHSERQYILDTSFYFMYCVSPNCKMFVIDRKERNLLMLVFLLFQVQREQLAPLDICSLCSKNLGQKQLDTARYHFLLTLKHNIYKKWRFFSVFDWFLTTTITATMIIILANKILY